jgi:hypothetical protein
MHTTIMRLKLGKIKIKKNFFEKNLQNKSVQALKSVMLR